MIKHERVNDPLNNEMCQADAPSSRTGRRARYPPRMATPREPRAERHLAWLLRLTAPFLLLAWPTLLLPAEIQAAWHERLGLGAFPASPLVDYLTRTIAVLYGTRGLAYWLLASDVRRYQPIILFFGWMDVVSGLLFFAIDLHAGLPGYWVAIEGPSLVIVGVLFIVLARRVGD